MGYDPLALRRLRAYRAKLRLRVHYGLPAYTAKIELRAFEHSLLRRRR